MSHAPPSGAGTAPEPRTHRSQLTLSRRGLLTLLVASALPWAVVGFVALHDDATGRPARPTPPASPHTGQPCRPGPWGQLTWTELSLEPPLEYMETGWAHPLTSVWHFAGMTEPAVSEVLARAGLPADLRRQLEDRAHWQTSPEGIELRPPDAVLRALPPISRERIYAVLAPLRGNATQETPFTFLPGQFAAHVAQSSLSTTTIALAESLLYQRGAVMLMSDMFTALNAVSDPAEKQALVQAVGRMHTLMLRLHVDASSDIEGLLAYWGRGGRAKSLRPLLAAMARVPGGCDVDIVSLLPEFARLRLYTFPTPDPEGVGRQQDCYWSAINFFSEGDSDAQTGTGDLNDQIRREYFQLPGEPAFGDVLFLVLPTGESIHAAVYIADGIVFTKNGGYPHQPWMLMRLDDLALTYGGNRVQQEILSVMAWRRRDF